MTTIENKQVRDQLLKEAEVKREKGQLQEALEDFNNIAMWDETQEPTNPKASLVYGHLRITYARLALHETNTSVKSEYLRNAEEAAAKGLRLLEGHPTENGLKAIMQIHLAGAKCDLAGALENNDPGVMLQEALEQVENAILVLPGSQAHKAWPIRLKVEILRKLGRYEEALKEALNAIELIHKGYQDEVKADSSAAELKIPVWLSGLYIQLAKLAHEQDAPLLAKFYANTVLSMEDVTGTLTERKKEAQEVLDSAA